MTTGTQIFDDGSTLVYDDAGQLVSYTSSQGVPQPVPGPSGSAIVQQFTDLFNYGVRSVIDAQYRRSAAAPPPGAPAAQAFSLTPQTKNLLLLGVAGLLAYKLLL